MMMQRFSHLAAALGLLLLAPIPAGAEGASPANAPACPEAVGTFLLSKVDATGGTTGLEGRVLLVLTNDGHALLTDSAQGGVAGYQPFSGAKGAWRRLARTEDRIEVSMRLLDFTFPTEEDLQQRIARIDTRAEFDVTGGRLTGRTEVSFTAIQNDPLDPKVLQSPVAYAFEGVKIEAPLE